jgi:transposase InsO family protein
MAWEQRNALDQRKDFIQQWLKQDHSTTELSRMFDISRKTAYKWLDRFQEQGYAGLGDRSRAPEQCPHAIDDVTSAAIIAERHKHPNWGSRKIRELLKRQAPETSWPAASSIGELLKRAGLIIERKKRHKTPPYSKPLEHAIDSNHVWCADFKGWFRCGDGLRCDPLTMTDAYSRYLLCCRATAKTDGIHVKGVMEAAFRRYGLPLAMRTDNGSPFASRAPAGLSRLSMWWLRLGIRHERIEPGCPEQNGQHERMHRTLKEEVANPPAPNLRRQQQAFVDFQHTFNVSRPHEALDWKTPSELYVVSTRPYPERLPELEYPAGVHLRRISQQGSLKWKCGRTFLSEVLARETVGLLEVNDDFFEVYYGTLFIGCFDGQAQCFEPEPSTVKPKGRHSHSRKAVEITH